MEKTRRKEKRAAPFETAHYFFDFHFISKHDIIPLALKFTKVSCIVQKTSFIIKFPRGENCLNVLIFET
jgi:hypothetical protein